MFHGKINAKRQEQLLFEQSVRDKFSKIFDKTNWELGPKLSQLRHIPSKDIFAIYPSFPDLEDQIQAPARFWSIVTREEYLVIKQFLLELHAELKQKYQNRQRELAKQYYC